MGYLLRSHTSWRVSYIYDMRYSEHTIIGPSLYFIKTPAGMYVHVQSPGESRSEQILKVLVTLVGGTSDREMVREYEVLQWLLKKWALE